MTHDQTRYIFKTNTIAVENEVLNVDDVIETAIRQKVKIRIQGGKTMHFPFNELPNTAALTCCHILESHMPIRYVSHDEDDGMWQFLCGENHDMDEARMVSLYSVFARDNSVAQLADMPCGCVAERRDRVSDWIIRKNWGECWKKN